MQSRQNNPSSATVPKSTYGTFGLYRYFLAVLVILTHTLPASWRLSGEYAVFAFFILSGYVVSYILSNDYLGDDKGLGRYAVNRLLRVYPLYWAAFCFSLILVIYFPQENRDILPRQGLPDTTGHWLINIFTFGMTGPLSGIPPSLLILTPGWSLAVEMTYWAIIPLMLRCKIARDLFIFLALFYTGYIFILSLPLNNLSTEPVRYFNTLAAAWPFCTGMMIFRWKSAMKIPVGRKSGIGAGFAFLLLLAVAPFLSPLLQLTSFYISVGLNAVIIACLSDIETRRLSSLNYRLDKLGGNLSSPLYLMHTPVAVLLHRFFPALSFPGPAFCVCTVLLATIAAGCMHILLQAPVDRLRKAIKARR